MVCGCTSAFVSATLHTGRESGSDRLHTEGANASGSCEEGKDKSMPTVSIVYWKGEQFWLGKILEHPEIMSQGESLEELEENLRDAYRLLVLEDVPADAQ